MPTVNGQPYPANRWRESGGTVLTAGTITDGQYLTRSGTTITSAAVSGGGSPQALAGGRLTLTTGTPVTTSDLTSQSTLYYTPFIHDIIGNYNGTSWDAVTFTELSLALSGLTSGKNYDVLFYKNAGANTIDLMPAWTNDTTRADAIARQNGAWTNSGSITTVINSHSVSANRGTLLGTIRTTGTTTTEDSATKRFLWNADNRVAKTLTVIDTTDSWTYTTTSWRQARGASTNQVEYVCGLAGGIVSLSAQSSGNYSGGAAMVRPGIGLDSTTVNSAVIGGGQTSAGSVSQLCTAFYTGYQSLGYHYIAWLEISQFSTGTMTWHGDAGVTPAGSWQTGITGCIFA